ncbi:hypothetical protein [Spirosoma linguale]|uniref:Uncharacterized protein n=1 Tax=Spirosoma linguale (strain ATCC 33905 / DSM 74 / LMG 10896 / Claus 1) TaxID=504472 RepID=D2QDK3_SPILD|nr:hypothetical protein Slin_2094 [Spirosoma linguale DSM 74]
MKTLQLRKLVRWIHLLGAAAIGTYVYAPWHTLTWFTLLMQIMVIPSLSLTGLWLWKGHLLRRKTAARSLPFHP